MDPNDLNSLSEVESLSDSDWLDISSRASEDNDSLTDSDTSDREEDSRPPSRRSLASGTSLREDDVHGWEGIIEDTADETLASLVHLDADAAVATSHADPNFSVSQQSLSFRTIALSETAVAQHTALADPEEEQRVKDALDQSMVSTLSTSRSNSLNASVQTSVVHSRDLRLSFPDPLTSSSPRADSPNPSYEDITLDMATSEGSTQAGNTQAPTHAVEEEGIHDVHTMAPTAVDPGIVATPVIARDGARMNLPASSVVDFSIVLYGASSAIKYRIVHRLLEKLMAATQCGFSSLPQIDVPQNIRILVNSGRPAHRIISIIDYTESVSCGKEPDPVTVSDRPSLAIIFLPSRSLSTSVSGHTLYLPVLTQDNDVDDDVDDVFAPIDRLLDAEYQWDTMGVPKNRLASSAFTLSKSAVIEEEEIERASPVKVARVFRPLLPWTEQWSGYHIASRHAFTLFAILSIVLGYLVHGSVPLSGTRHATPTIDLVSRPAPTPMANASIAQPVLLTTSTTLALIPSSLKEFALAAISPYAMASTSSVASKAVPSPTTAPVEPVEQPHTPSECACGCGLITWTGKFRPTTDLMLRPTPPTPSLVSQARHKGNPPAAVLPPPTVMGKGKSHVAEDESLYALSTRLAGALTEYLDMRTMFAHSRHDLQEIYDALDELSQAITEQTETAWVQSKSTLQVVQENIRARHARARTRAKELRAVGGRFLSSVSAQVRGRVSMAKENARVLRDGVRVQRDDSFRVLRERRGDRRRERWVDRRMRRAQHVE